MVELDLIAKAHADELRDFGNVPIPTGNILDMMDQSMNETKIVAAVEKYINKVGLLGNRCGLSMSSEWLRVGITYQTLVSLHLVKG